MMNIEHGTLNIEGRPVRYLKERYLKEIYQVVK